MKNLMTPNITPAIALLAAMAGVVPVDQTSGMTPPASGHCRSRPLRALTRELRPAVRRWGHQESSDHGREPLHPIEHALVGRAGKQD